MNENDERWRVIDGFEGLYEVSNFGRVRSLSRWVAACKGRRLVEGKILLANKHGYYQTVMLCNGDNVAYRTVHGLVARAFVLGSGEVVRHFDGDPNNNIVDNLAWGSHKDNAADKRRHGRVPEGHHHHNAKLNPSQVREIRDMANRGLTQLAIAKHMNVNRGTVGYIVRGESYKNVG